MLKKLVLKSHITDVDASSRRMIAAFRKSDRNSDEHLGSAFGELSNLSTRLTEAILPGKVLSQLRSHDRERIGRFRKLYHLVIGLLHHPDEEISGAAGDVAIILRKYGLKTTDKSYATKTSWLSSLLQDLSQAELQDAVLALPGCVENISSLNDAQREFELARLNYEEIRVRERKREKASRIKSHMLEVINEDIVTYLKAMLRADPEPYQAFAEIIGKIIESNNLEVKNRRKRNAKDT